MVPGRAPRRAKPTSCLLRPLSVADDEVHTPESAHALFDRIASTDKHLHSSPGPHEGVPQAVHEAALEFLARRLRAAV